MSYFVSLMKKIFTKVLKITYICTMYKKEGIILLRIIERLSHLDRGVRVYWTSLTV